MRDIDDVQAFFLCTSLAIMAFYVFAWLFCEIKDFWGNIWVWGKRENSVSESKREKGFARSESDPS